MPMIFTKITKQNSPTSEEQAAFEKEKGEHPEFSDADIWKIVKDHERKNSQDWPSKYTCNFLEAGVVSYEDVGAGVALLKKETIDRVLNSIVGKPVLIDHQDVTPRDFKKNAVGYVTDARFNAATGWFDCDFILTEDEAKRVVSNGYSVSCAFDVKRTMQGGEWHACKYDEEIADLEFTHLALVTTPRYEDCRIMVNSKKAKVNKKCKGCSKEAQPNTDYCCEACKVKHEGQNSKLNTNQKETKIMFGLGKKKNIAAHPSVDENDPAKKKFNAAECFVRINGVGEVTMDELLKYQVADAKEEFKTEMSMEDSIETEEGVKLNVKDLVNNYLAANDKKEEGEEKKEDDKKEEGEEKKEDAKPEEEEKKKEDAKPEEEKKEDAKPEGEDDEEKKERAESDKKEHSEEEKEEKPKETIEKKNDKEDKIKHFRKLNSLKDLGSALKEMAVDTMSSRVSRGNDRYSSKKKEEAK